MIVFRLYVEALVSVSSSLMFFGKFGGNFKTGWELQNRAWLPHIDRQAHDMHAQFFLPINFRNSRGNLNLMCFSVWIVIWSLIE